jgi:hypothetical protein
MVSITGYKPGAVMIRYDPRGSTGSRFAGLPSMVTKV